MSNISKFLFFILFSMMCCSFAFWVVAIYLNNGYFYNEGLNTDFSLFREHQAACSICSACMDDDDNLKPCEEGFKIMFSCIKN
jgi:hypothetical protein